MAPPPELDGHKNMDLQSQNKKLLEPLRAAMYDFDRATVRAILHQICAPDVVFRLSFPFETIEGVDAFVDTVFGPLAVAWPDLERRDHIVIAGPTPEGDDWVGCGGWYTGTFRASWLDIPPTGHIAHMRFHEFYRVEAGKVVEMQALWDIPEVMMQAQAWPMQPGLGRHWHVPGPATQDGIVVAPYDLSLIHI